MVGRRGRVSSRVGVMVGGEGRPWRWISMTVVTGIIIRMPFEEETLHKERGGTGALLRLAGIINTRHDGTHFSPNMFSKLTLMRLVIIFIFTQ